MKEYRGLWALGAAVFGVFSLTRVAVADVTTEQGGSIVVWPKVIWDGQRDTLLQLSNLYNAMVHVHCVYINGAPVNPALPVSDRNPPQWTETDFDLWLSKQQPTHWTASGGRRVSALDDFGTDGAGLDPGVVPPLPQGFTGELKCVQVSESGEPMTGNKLKGEATLRTTSGDVSRYNAIAIPGNANLSGIQIGTTLDLNLTDANPDGEYDACPNVLSFSFFNDGDTDPVANVPIDTFLTLVPCDEDIENGNFTEVRANFLIIDEFEQQQSASIIVDCWTNRGLRNINPVFGQLPTLTGHARLTPADGYGGLLGVAEELRSSAWAAFNLHIEGNRFDAEGVTDTIVIPSL